MQTPTEPLKSENSAVGKHCHSKAEFEAECAVRLLTHGVQSLELFAEHRPLGSVDRMRPAVYLASRQGTAETEHGGS
jgi:hypothetical protein